MFLKQDKKCALTGYPLHFGRNRNTPETNASLDRIDSSKGYKENNVQWVLKDINRMKWQYNTDYFVKLCKLVAKHNSYYKQQKLHKQEIL